MNQETRTKTRARLESALRELRHARLDVEHAAIDEPDEFGPLLDKIKRAQSATDTALELLPLEVEP